MAAGLAVALVALLAAVVLPPPRSLPGAAPAAVEGAVALVPTGPEHTAAVGWNSEGITTGATPYDSPQVAAALSSLRSGVLRWPGGTLASYWDWRSGTVVPAGPSNPPAWVRRSAERIAALPDGHTLAALARARRDAPSRPDVVFVLNTLTGTDGRLLRFREGLLSDGLDDQLALLRAARDAGLPVTRVELGNEPWAGGPGEGRSDYEEVWGRPRTAPALYADVARVWARAVVAEFPGAQVAVAGAPRTTDFPRPERWNGPLLDGVVGEPAVAAVSFHVYVRPRGAREGVPEALGPVDTAAAVDARLDVFADREVADAALRAPTLDVWVTEGGMFDESGDPLHGTWEHGLVEGRLALELPARGGELYVAHTLLDDAVFGAVYLSRSGLELKPPFGAPAPVPRTRSGALTAKGTALARVAEARAGRPQQRTLAAQSASAGDDAGLVRAPRLAGGAPALVGEVACPEDSGDAGGGCACVLVNSGPEAVRVALPPGVLDGDGPPPRVDGVAADPATYVTGEPTDALRRVGPVAQDGTLMLPPSSVTAVLPRG